MKLKESVGIRVLSPPLMASFEPFEPSVGPSNSIFLRVLYIKIYYYIKWYRFRMLNTSKMMSHVVVVNTRHIGYQF